MCSEVDRDYATKNDKQPSELSTMTIDDPVAGEGLNNNEKESCNYLYL